MRRLPFVVSGQPFSGPWDQPQEPGHGQGQGQQHQGQQGNKEHRLQGGDRQPQPPEKQPGSPSLWPCPMWSEATTAKPRAVSQQASSS